MAATANPRQSVANNIFEEAGDHSFLEDNQCRFLRYVWG